MLPKIAYAPIFVLMLHVIATVLGWYEMFFWLDTPMHFLGGAGIGISSYYFLHQSELETKKFHTKLFNYLLILALTALAAVAWEILEFHIDRALNTVMQPSVLDTMKDLAFGLLGGSISAAILLMKKPSKA